MEARSFRRNLIEYFNLNQQEDKEVADVNEIAEIFDTRADGQKCVRFESGQIGVVDEQGKVIYQTGKFRHIEFMEHDFVKLRASKVEVLQNQELRYMLRAEGCQSTHIFFVDLKSGQMYGSMPELHQYGDFEVAFLCGRMFTRTKECHRADVHPSFVWSSDNGLFLQFPADDTPEEAKSRQMLYRHRLNYRCLIKGDEDKTYWIERKFEDESVAIMDDEGRHYYVRMDGENGKVVWRTLGRAGNAAERSQVSKAINDIAEEVRSRKVREEEEAEQAAARQRKQALKAMAAVVPFRIGSKWGLKKDGRMVVPPMYRAIHTPVGKYCAVEAYPGIWGVIAIDGKMEIEPGYENVVLHADGTAELTVTRGRVIKKKLH